MKIVCDITGDEKEARTSPKGAAILPRGWRRFSGQVWCDKAWKQYYYIAAVTIPVLKPVNGEWKDLRDALKVSWQQSTSLSNWLMTELCKADVTRDPTVDKMPPMPTVNLYQAARARFPNMPTASLSSILQSVGLKYRAKRYEVVWLCKASLPNYRYPTPFPMRAQGWKAEHGPEGEPVISCRLDGKRWHLQLKRGPGFHRQHAAFAKMVDGEAMGVEMALYQQRIGSGERANLPNSRRPGDGGFVPQRLMAKLVMWLPKPTGERVSDGVLAVATAPDALLCAIDQNDKCWTYNADHARRYVAEHSRVLQRLAEDRKAEWRYPKRRGAQIQRLTEQRCAKYRRRMNTVIDQVSSALANYARRRRVNLVTYNDTCRGYLASFPYHELEVKVWQKLDRLGIAFEKQIEVRE